MIRQRLKHNRGVIFLCFVGFKLCFFSISIVDNIWTLNDKYLMMGLQDDITTRISQWQCWSSRRKCDGWHDESESQIWDAMFHLGALVMWHDIVCWDVDDGQYTLTLRHCSRFGEKFTLINFALHFFYVNTYLNFQNLIIAYVEG